MVSPNHGRVLRSLEPVPPLLQCPLDGKQLTITHVVVSFGWGKLPGEKGTRVSLAIARTPLGKDGAKPRAGGVHLDQELEVGIGLPERR